MSVIKFPKYKIGDTVYCQGRKGSIVRVIITNWRVEDNQIRYIAENEDYEYGNISEDRLDFRIDKLINKIKKNNQ
jgi:hypothetical protein